jgi:hypothetical protein
MEISYKKWAQIWQPDHISLTATSQLNTENCWPVAVALGSVRRAQDDGGDWWFLPAH